MWRLVSIGSVAAALAVGCQPSFGRAELDAASKRLDCPVERLDVTQIAPPRTAKKTATSVTTGSHVFEVSGCGQKVTLRSVCTPTALCAFRADEPARAISAAASDAAADASQGLGAQLSPSSSPLSKAAIFARSYQSTVTLKTDRGMGSGFAVTVDGLVVSNLHVVAGASKIDVRFVDGHEGVVDWVEAYDATWDLALLRINRNLHALPLDSGERTGIGDEIVALGNPLGLQATLSEGIVSGFRRLGDWDVVQVTAAISPGSSGGPILNRYGEVVAVSTFLLKEGNSLAFGTPAKYIRSLLANRKRLELAELARLTQGDADAACSDQDMRTLAGRVGAALKAGIALEQRDEYFAARSLYEGALTDLGNSLDPACVRQWSDLARPNVSDATATSDQQRALDLRQALERLRAQVQGWLAP